VEEIAVGLVRWTAYHDDWDEEVGCLAVETSDGRVLIDPLEPPRGLREADHVLLTVFWHYRSTKELPGARVWAPTRSVQPLRNRGVPVTDAFRPGERLPGAIQAFQTARVSEVVYWLPDQRAVAVGDVLLGAGAKPRATDAPLRLCPQRWLGKRTHDDLRKSLAPLLDLPVERVLVSHGKPIQRAPRGPLEQVLAM
jgi:hypothetical protein